MNEKIKRTEYVLGFYFDETMDNVVLIEKKKPKWQEGSLNGLGGKIQEGEELITAMQREFREESGVDVDYWQPICTMGGQDWVVHVFFAVEKNNQKFEAVDTKEEETVMTVEVDKLLEYEIVSNLQWLIPLCIDKGLYENSNYQAIIQF